MTDQSMSLVDELVERVVVHGCRTERDYIEVPLVLRDRILSALRAREAPVEVGDLVEQAVAAWHATSDESLHEWLGWTWAEYEAWVANPEAIPRPPKFFAALITRQASELAERDAVIVEAAVWFEEYAASHQAQADAAPVGSHTHIARHDKAQRNRERAAYLRAFIARQEQQR